jgi:Na+-transporting methylmalonyl-CoA/oxaloacetate decarboxylase gamma subunit
VIPLGTISAVEGLLGPKFGRFAKPLIVGAGIVLLLLAVLAVVKIHDHRVIATHEAKQDAANAKADRQADAKAAEQRRTDDTRTTQESQQVKEAVNDARSQGRDPRTAYYKCVELQQRARAAKLVVPACV